MTIRNAFCTLAVLALTLVLAVPVVAQAEDAAAPPQATAPQQQQQPASAELWTVRCNPADEKTEDGKPSPGAGACEVFQRLIIQKTGQRVTEMAIGFPRNEKGEKEKDARGVLVLPLGILLTDEIVMQIDTGKKFKFRVRHCTAQGCFAYLTLNKGAISAFRKGEIATIKAQASTGQPLEIKLGLKGFSAAFDKI